MRNISKDVHFITESCLYGKLVCITCDECPLCFDKSGECGEVGLTFENQRNTMTHIHEIMIGIENGVNNEQG